MSRGIDYSKWDHFNDDSSSNDDDDDNPRVQTTRLEAPSSVTFGGKEGLVQINTPTTTTAAAKTNNNNDNKKASTPSSSVRNPENTAVSSVVEKPPASAAASNDLPKNWTHNGGHCRLINDTVDLVWCQDRYSVTLRFHIASQVVDEGKPHQPRNNKWSCVLHGQVYSYKDRTMAVSTERARLRITRPNNNNNNNNTAFVLADDEIPYPVHWEEGAEEDDQLDWAIERHGAAPYLTITLFKAAPMAGLTLWWKRPLQQCPEREEDGNDKCQQDF